mmetsp:Transcript_17426/g.52612  ORF Transcript_17426/g.52612 Transcript_17426/m.52612 type:complete len:212 (-) Transcript_17426:577-1212(-)
MRAPLQSERLATRKVGVTSELAAAAAEGTTAPGIGAADNRSRRASISSALSQGDLVPGMRRPRARVTCPDWEAACLLPLIAPASSAPTAMPCWTAARDSPCAAKLGHAVRRALRPPSDQSPPVARRRPPGWRARRVPCGLLGAPLATHPSHRPPPSLASWSPSTGDHEVAPPPKARPHETSLPLACLGPTPRRWAVAGNGGRSASNLVAQG